MTFEKAVDTLCDSTGRALGSVINKFISLHNIEFSTFTKLYYKLCYQYNGVRLSHLVR